jgi:hypothetical protein
MLSLTEEMALLLYTHMRPASSDAEYDVVARNSVEMRLLTGAMLMELLLLGRVQVRPVSPAGRRLRVILGVLVFLLVAALFLGLPLQAMVSGIRWPVAISPPAAFVIGTVLPFLVVFAAAWASGWVLRDKLTIVDDAPTGDGILNDALQQLAQVGQQAAIRTYIRSFGRHVMPKMRGALIAQLEQKGLISPPTPGPTILGMLDRRQVRRERPEFQAIGERVRRVVLDHTLVDPQTTALLMLFAWSSFYRSVGWQLRAGIYQFFGPDEHEQVRASLRTLRRRDPAIAAEVGPDRYEALRAIAVGVMQVRQEDTTRA